MAPVAAPAATHPVGAVEPEDALLLACARAALGQPVERPDPAAIRWHVFARRMHWHGLTAIVSAVVRRWFEAAMPGEVAAELRQAVRSQAGHTLRAVNALRDIDEALRRAGVRYVILKGVPLAQATYGTIAARPSRDIDILVPPHAFTAARHALQALGYVSPWGLDPAREAVCMRFAVDLPLRGPDGFLVELHHCLDFNPRRAGTACARSLLAAAEPCRAGPIEVPSVVGATALPYLAWHGALHAWLRLVWLVDVAATTARAEERELAEAWDAAGDLGGQRPLALAWSLCEDLLGVPVPAPARRDAASPAIGRLSRRAQDLALGPVGLAAVGTVERRIQGLGWSLALASGPLARGRFLLRYLVDVGPDEIRTLPAWLAWAAPALRPARVAWRLATALGRKIPNGPGTGR